MYDDKKSWEKEYFMANNLSFFDQHRSKKAIGRLSEPILNGCLAKYLLF